MGSAPSRLFNVVMQFLNEAYGVQSRTGVTGQINPVGQEYCGDHRPASALLEISALMSSNFKVEIDAGAVLD